MAMIFSEIIITYEVFNDIAITKNREIPLRFVPIKTSLSLVPIISQDSLTLLRELTVFNQLPKTGIPFLHR